MTDRIMLRRLKKDHTDSMELPVKEIYVDRQFFSEVENDFAQSIMGGAQRNFDTYVAQGVLLNNCKQLLVPSSFDTMVLTTHRPSPPPVSFAPSQIWLVTDSLL